MKGDAIDPKALIREAYRIDGISLAECRSIFVDWALSLPGEVDVPEAIARLLDRHGTDDPDHPMSAVLREGQAPAPTARRKGGRQGRLRGA